VTSRQKDIPPANREAVAQRSKGICEGCGKAPATEIHHRRYKSRGGGHEVSNLIHLCGWGNHTGCHGRAHKGGESIGWSVFSGIYVPSLIPVWYRRSGWVLFDDEGGAESLLAAAAQERMALYRLLNREVS
jgi:hypothetical protein